MERPRGQTWLGHQSARGRLDLWDGHQQGVEQEEWALLHLARTPTDHGGVGVDPREAGGHHL